MTDREAIKVMKWYTECVDHEIMNECYYGHLTAISALQEREERAIGCEWCKFFKNDPQFLFSRGNGRYDELMFEFCPICGRKLKGAMPGEEA